MLDENKEYGAIAIDTSIFDNYGLRLESGLLGKLSQFQRSPTIFLIPDVIYNEVKGHIVQSIKKARSSLDKAMNDAADHIFYEGSELAKDKPIIPSDYETQDLAEKRMSQFVNVTGAEVLVSEDFVSISQLLARYFSSSPPFAETGKKKSEFPDAIVLLCIEAWAEEKDMQVLVVAKDSDWEKYCESSARIDYEVDLSKSLIHFNKADIPFLLVSSIEEALNEGKAQQFHDAVVEHLESYFDGFTPDQDAESQFYWEPDGSHGWFNSFEFTDNQFKVVDKGEDWVVLEAEVLINIGAEGDFSLSAYDSIDKDYVPLDRITVEVEEELETPILITLHGELDGLLDELAIDEVEVIDTVRMINFGTLEPDFGPYE